MRCAVYRLMLEGKVWRSGRGWSGHPFRYHLLDRPTTPAVELDVSTPSMSDDVLQASGALLPTAPPSPGAHVPRLLRRSMKQSLDEYTVDTESDLEHTPSSDVVEGDADFIRRPTGSVGALSRFIIDARPARTAENDVGGGW
jgi:hypothetical protein